MNDSLYDLPDDVLIYTIAFLSVPDILLLRQTCKRFHALTRLHIVWTNAFKLDILSKDYPYSLDSEDLEQRTCHAYRLASRWITSCCLTPSNETSFCGSPVSEIKFIPGRQHKWLLTVSKVIWSVLTIWDIERGHKCSEWSPKGGIFTGVKLNTDPDSEASVAVSLDGSNRIILLHLDDFGVLHEIQSIDTNLRPVNITGDVIALCDDLSLTVIYNWKTKERALLHEGDDSQNDHCIQVVFTLTTILVVRARSIHLYANPPLLGQTYQPIATHSFGWVDDVSVPSPAPNSPLSILIRSQSNNPWASELNSLELYAIPLTQNASPPYTFPPTLISKMSSRRGALRCTDVVLGNRSTAVWIRPHDRAMVSHWEEHDGCETLIAAVFPGPLNTNLKVRVREVCSNTLNNWTALDYDEDLGRIALGSSFGKVTVVQL